MKLMAWVLARPGVYRFAGKTARWVTANLPFLVKNKTWNPWFKQREMPETPKQSFQEWYKKQQRS